MSAFTLAHHRTVDDAELIALYESVGWSAYTRDLAVLRRALAGSSLVVSARDGEGTLIGLARAVSDDATICYLQDILVTPAAQGAGVGRALVESVLARFEHVRQTVLTTDDEPRQRSFYEGLGFVEGADIAHGPLRMFALLR